MRGAAGLHGVAPSGHAAGVINPKQRLDAAISKFHSVVQDKRRERKLARQHLRQTPGPRRDEWRGRLATAEATLALYRSRNPRDRARVLRELLEFVDFAVRVTGQLP